MYINELLILITCGCRGCLDKPELTLNKLKCDDLKYDIEEYLFGQT